MAVIYLSHPIHGAKVAISDMEADNDEANGWVRFDPTAPVVEAVAEAQEEAPAPVVNELPRRRGRPARSVE